MADTSETRIENKWGTLTVDGSMAFSRSNGRRPAEVTAGGMILVSALSAWQKKPKASCSILNLFDFTGRSI
jgi:hypothetical protein